MANENEMNEMNNDNLEITTRYGSDVLTESYQITPAEPSGNDHVVAKVICSFVTGVATAVAGGVIYLATTKERRKAKEQEKINEATQNATLPLLARIEELEALVKKLDVEE